MKHIALTCSLIFSLALLSAQNNILRGIVKLQSSGSQPLSGVKISAFGSTSSYSNSSGMFELNFPTKQAGSSVSLIIDKTGYELINDKELENCVLREQADDLVIIVMAKQGQRDRQALVYYNIIVENATKTFSRELRSINSKLEELDEDDNDRLVLRKQIDALQTEKEALIKRAEELAKQLAVVDLDHASDLAKAAYEKFQSGDIQGALAVLDDQVLATSLQTALDEKAKLQEQFLRADSAYQQSIDNYMIKARFSISDQQYDAAVTYYQQAINADSSNLTNLRELADYYAEQNKQDKAIDLYQTSLQQETSTKTRAVILNNLGNQYASIYNFEKAEEAYTESLILKKQLFEAAPIQYGADYASGLSNLASMYNASGQYEKAASSYLETLDLYAKIAKETSENFTEEIAFTQTNLGALYLITEQFETALTVLSTAVDTFRILATDSTTLQNENLAFALGNLAIAQKQTGQYTAAEKAYLEVITINEALALENPQRYKADYARSYMSLGVFYYTTEAFEKSDISLQKSLHIYRELAENNPKRYHIDFCRVLLNAASIKGALLQQQLDIQFKQEGLALVHQAQAILTQQNNTIPLVQSLVAYADEIENEFNAITAIDLSIQKAIRDIDLHEASQEKENQLEIKITHQKKVIEQLDTLLSEHPQSSLLLDRTALAYGDLAWYQLLHQQFELAETAARHCLVLAPEQKRYHSYLALSLLYQNKIDAARNIYINLKDQTIGEQRLQLIFLEDLNALESQAVYHPDSAIIRQLLEE